MSEPIKFLNFINNLKVLKGENITYSEFAKALGIKTASISKRLARNTYINEKEMQLLEDYFKIDASCSFDKDRFIKLHYYKNENLKHIIENPLISEIYMDREVVKNMWNVNVDNLRLIAMPGDKMEGSPSYQLHIRNRDVLLMDISATDINLSGIYAYETLGGTKIQISNVSTMTDGNVRFYYTNKVYSDEIRTQNRLNDLGFKVIGRIIKNLSFIHI